MSQYMHTSSLWDNNSALSFFSIPKSTTVYSVAKAAKPPSLAFLFTNTLHIICCNDCGLNLGAVDRKLSISFVPCLKGLSRRNI